MNKKKKGIKARKGSKKATRKPPPPQYIQSEVDPLSTPPACESGADTTRRYDYQFAFGAIVALKIFDSSTDVVALYADLHDDLFIQHSNGNFTAYQVTTQAKGLNPLRTSDEKVTKSIINALSLQLQFGGKVQKFIIANSGGFHTENKNEKNPSFFLERMNNPSLPGFDKCKIISDAILNTAKEKFSNLDLEEMLGETFKKLEFFSAPELDGILERLQNLVGQHRAIDQDITLENVEEISTALTNLVRTATSVTQGSIRASLGSLLCDPTQRHQQFLQEKKIDRQRLIQTIGAITSKRKSNITDSATNLSHGVSPTVFLTRAENGHYTVNHFFPAVPDIQLGMRCKFFDGDDGSANSEIQEKDFSTQFKFISEHIDKHEFSQATELLEAVEEVSHTDGINRNKAKWFALKAKLSSFQGDYDLSAKNFLHSAKFEPNQELVSLRNGYACLLKGQLDEAAGFARNALSLNANLASAYGMLIASSDETNFDQRWKEVPEHISSDRELLYAKAWALKRLDRTKEALAAFHELRMNPSSVVDIDSEAAYGELLAQTTLKALTSQDSLRYETKNCLEAFNILDNCWKRVANSNLRSSRASWLFNKGLMGNVLGGVYRENALEDLKVALSLQPDNPIMIKGYGLALLQVNEPKLALEEFDKIINLPEMPEVNLLMADALASEKRYSEALKKLKFRSQSTPLITAEAFKLAISILISQKRLASARRLGKIFAKIDYSSSQVINVSLSRLAGNFDIAIQDLEKISKTSLSARELVDVADEWIALRKPNKAIELFKSLPADNNDSLVNRKFVDSLFRAGRLEELESKCKAVLLSSPSNSYYIFGLANSYLRRGDLDSAREAFEAIPEQSPDSITAKIRTAEIDFRKGQQESVLKFLQSVRDVSQWNLDNLHRFSELCVISGRKEQPLRLIYERRLLSPSEEADKAFASIFFRIQDDELLKIPTVRNGCAVRLKDANDEEQWVIIDSSVGTKDSRSISFDDAFAQELIGKPVQAKIENGLKGKAGPFTVVEIVDKYVLAYRETLSSICENEFDKRETFIEKIREETARAAEAAEEISKLYAAQSISIGKFAALSGRSYFETWRYLQLSNREKLHSNTGSREEKSQALSVLQGCKNKSKVVMDISALLAVGTMPALQDIVTSCLEPIIVQSSVDELVQTQLSLSGPLGKGHTVVTQVEGELRRFEVTADQIAAEKKVLDDTIEWVRKNCSVSPLNYSEEWSSDVHNSLGIALGLSTSQSFILAQQLKLPLYADDRMLGGIETSTFSTQYLLLYAVNEGKINELQYRSSILELNKYNYSYISVSVDLLRQILASNEWQSSEEFIRLISFLRQSNFNEIVDFAVNFITVVWQECHDSTKRREILFNFMENAVTKETRKIFYERLENALIDGTPQTLFRRAEILNALDSWYSKTVLSD